jgi:tellurite resistance protein
MNAQEAETIVAIAALAALADGKQSESERANVVAAAKRLGVESDNPIIQDAVSGRLGVGTLATRLTSNEARIAAYDAAAAVCHADGTVDDKESAFLAELMRALGSTSGSESAGVTVTAAGAAISAPGRVTAPAGELETFILDQPCSRRRAISCRTTWRQLPSFRSNCAWFTRSVSATASSST